MATKTSAKSVWEVLSKIDVSGYMEKKNGLDYVSWTHAWSAVKQAFPTASFMKHTFVDNQHNVLPFMRDYKGKANLQDYKNVGKNVATVGMLTGGALREDQEQQR